MENRLGSQKQYGVYSRLDILSRETSANDLWYKNIKLKDIEQSWISYKINNSSKIKREQIKEYKYFIKRINEYIENNTKKTEVDTPYYSYYTEVNRHLSFFVNKLQLDLEDLEEEKIIFENNLSDYEVVENDDDNIFIKNNEIKILIKNDTTYIDFINLNFTDVLFIMYYIFIMEPLKYNNQTSRIVKSSGAKNPLFNNIRSLNKFIQKHCLSNSEEFNEGSYYKLMPRIKEKYRELNPKKDTKTGYIEKTKINNDQINSTNKIIFTTERQFKEFISETKYNFDSKYSIYLQLDNFIELLKLINKTFKIV